MRYLFAPIVVALVVSITPATAECPCPVDLSGRWHGCWISDKNGHHGPLNATFRKTGDSCYRVTFTGRFWKVFPFIYSVNLNVTEVRDGSVVLTGSSQLGPVLGSFQYNAEATANSFEAHFTSKGDHGRFLLKR